MKIVTHHRYLQYCAKLSKAKLLDLAADHNRGLINYKTKQTNYLMAIFLLFQSNAKVQCCVIIIIIDVLTIACKSLKRVSIHAKIL